MGIATNAATMEEGGRPSTPRTFRVEIKRTDNRAADAKRVRRNRWSLLSLLGSGRCIAISDEVKDLRDQVTQLVAQMDEMQKRIQAAEAPQEPAAPTAPSLQCSNPAVPNGCAPPARRTSSKAVLLRVPSTCSTPRKTAQRRRSAPQPSRVGKVDSDLAARLEMQRAKAATHGVNVESVAPGEKKALTSFRASTSLAVTLSPAALCDRSGNMWIDGVPRQSQRVSLSSGEGGTSDEDDSSQTSMRSACPTIEASEESPKDEIKESCADDSHG